MVWKDTYNVGVQLIDEQHKELFERVSAFVDVVRSAGVWSEKHEKIEQTLSFMKEYVVVHFDAEEKYQKEIGFPLHEEHKKIHDDMVSYVLSVEKEYLENGASEKLIQGFAGKLLAWLINHVASDDRKIANFAKGKAATTQVIGSFYDSTKDVFNMMLNVETSPIKDFDISTKESIKVRINVVGDRTGQVVYHFPKATIFNMVKLMSGMEVTDVDDFVSSAVGEIANIISGKALIAMSEQNINCDILPPEFTTADFDNTDDSVRTFIDTEIGKMMIDVSLTKV